MSGTKFSKKACTALEARVTSSLANVGGIDTLLAWAGEGLSLEDACIVAGSLRRVFTHFFHNNTFRALGSSSATAASATATTSSSSSSAATPGSKRKRAEVDGAALDAAGDVLAGWLRSKFWEALDAMLKLLCRAHRSAEKEERAGSVDGFTAAVTALSTIMHFFAHGCSEAQQCEARGQHAALEVLVFLLRRCFAAEAEETATSSAARHTSRALAAALRSLRAEWIDDYDDVRYHVCQAVQQLAKEKAASAKAAVRKARTDSSIDTAAVQRELQQFARNAAELMLDISLPTSEALWSSAAHASFVQSEWAAFIPHVYAQVTVPGSSDADAAAASGSKVKMYSAADDSDSDEDIADLFGPPTTPAPAAPAAAGAGSGLGDGLRASSSSGKAAQRKQARSTDKATSSAEGAATPAAPASNEPFVPKYFQLAEVRRVFADAWLAVMALPLPAETHRRILMALPEAILPQMTDRSPLLLADYLTSCVNAGGANAVLALQSVFLLMQNHGLEYPHAYARLYSLLSASTVSTKYRARLFSLLDLFLSSAALPAYLVAAFIKKAARLALTCGTPFALFALPFIYNCVKRHPSVAPLLHRLTPVSYTAGAWPAPADPFDENAAAPESANALASSLWEVIALSQHTHAPVATLARALMKEATKAEYDVAEYSSAVYDRLVMDELNRTVNVRGGTKQAAEVPFGALCLPLFEARGGAPAAADDKAAASAGAEPVTSLWRVCEA